MSIPNAAAVFCGSNQGSEPAFAHAAKSLGLAISKSGMGFVYGGGYKGLMGIVSCAALEGGAKVTGIMPYAMINDSKEVHNMDDFNEKSYTLNENGQIPGREDIEMILVHSMHERKVEMAKRVRGFFGLPGGFGTYEELLEVTTWSQLGLHEKPVVILNVLGFYNPLRDLIRSAVRQGFILPQNEGLVIFVDGPSDLSAHEGFDWGTHALEAFNAWKKTGEGFGYDWTKRLGNKKGPRTQTNGY